LLDLPTEVRWTAGMIAQWSVEEGLRADLRRHLLDALGAKPYDVVCAHSLGSLICYDTFARTPAAIQDKAFLTCGSQIGNPFVRDVLAGRITPVAARIWYNLYNPEDHVFTTSIRLTAPNFCELRTDFDKPSDVLNHDPVFYFDHADARPAWQDLAGTLP